MNEETITEFKDEYRFLSNFYTSQVEYEGMTFPTVENAYQAAKTMELGIRRKFMLCSPAQAKSGGRRVVLRDDWEFVKADIMLNLVNQKFQQKNLKEMLLETGDKILLEGNWWHDNYWGFCMCESCRSKEIVGQNVLGKILMAVRYELQRSELSGNSQVLETAHQ